MARTFVKLETPKRPLASAGNACGKLYQKSLVLVKIADKERREELDDKNRETERNWKTREQRKLPRVRNHTKAREKP